MPANLPRLIGKAWRRWRTGEAERRAAATSASSTAHHAVEAALQHLLHLAGEVRQRTVGQRKRRRIEHGDCIARHDKRRAVGVDRCGGKGIDAGHAAVNGCQRREGEQPKAADKIHGVVGAQKRGRL